MLVYNKNADSIIKTKKVTGLFETPMPCAHKTETFIASHNAIYGFQLWRLT
jgi:hypothetical protein